MNACLHSLFYAAGFSVAFFCSAESLNYEAEAGLLLGATRVAHELPDGSGRGFVTGFVLPADGLDISVRVPSDGFYLLELSYACTTAKCIPVFVDGNLQGSRLLPSTHGFETRPFGRLHLTAGDHVIRIGTDWGYADLDFIRLSPASAPPPFQLSGSPVNPAASPEARALFNRLVGEFGRSTFAGQHESDSRNPSRLAHIALLTGDAAPAMLGLDLLYYSGSWNQPDGDGAIELARDWVLARHGIVTLSWHWLAPLQPGPLVWDSFSTNKSSFDVTMIGDERSPEYHAIVRDLDRIAGKLKILRDAGVPVLWRPLHEAEGGWFWWGARNPAATRLLYRLMFDRFTRVHHLDNLLWVWTSTGNDDAPDWYPGDNYVDFIAADLYARPGERGDFFTVFDRLGDLYGRRKAIALGECGVLPTLSPQAPWLWFLTWDDFIARPDINPPDTVAGIYRSPRVITRPRHVSPAPSSPLP